MESRPPLQLIAIPEEILHHEIAPRIVKDDLKTAMHFSETSRFFFQSFTKLNNQEAARRLLMLIKQADWNAIEKIINAHPTLMFERVQSTITEQSERISPVQYAFFLYDTYTWKILLQKIQNNAELIDLFLQQEEQQKNHIDLSPFFAAYADYRKKYAAWLENKITKEDVQQAWLTIGIMQGQFLPVHMLKEFCRADKLWRPYAPFHADLNTRPIPNIIYDYHRGQIFSLCPITTTSRLGKDFTLGRGSRMCCTWRKGTRKRAAAQERIREDCKIFEKLYQVRSNELTEQISQLTLSRQQRNASRHC